MDCSPLACNEESTTDYFARFGADWFGFGAGAKETSTPHRGPLGRCVGCTSVLTTSPLGGGGGVTTVSQTPEGA